MNIRFIALVSSLLLREKICSSQEAPMSNSEMWDENIFYRTNVCDRQQRLSNGELNVRNALRGLNLSVFIVDYTHFPLNKKLFELSDEREIRKIRPGLVVVLLDELGKRAGFKWRNKFATGIIDDNDGKNKTWTDLLEWSTDKFDISADYWNPSNERRALGISFPAFWYDDSMIVVSSKVEKNIFGNFFRPFDIWVWFVIALLMLLTGCLYRFLQWMSSLVDTEYYVDERRPNAFDAVFLSSLAFTGHYMFQPNSSAARILSISWAFWALIMASTYTANMATVLISPEVPEFKANSFEEVVQMNKTLCLWGDTNHDDFMKVYYPNATVERKSSNADVLNGLLDEDDLCDAALTGKMSFSLFQHSDENCGSRLRRVSDKIFLSVRGSFALKVDAGTHCTSLISHVLDLHMTEMRRDGFLDAAWDQILNKRTNMCGDRSGSFSEEESTPLMMSDLSGIFLFHAIACFISLSLAIFQKNVCIFYLIHRLLRTCI